MQSRSPSHQLIEPSVLLPRDCTSRKLDQKVGEHSPSNQGLDCEMGCGHAILVWEAHIKHEHSDMGYRHLKHKQNIHPYLLF